MVGRWISRLVHTLQRVIEGWGKNEEGTYMQQIASLKQDK